MMEHIEVVIPAHELIVGTAGGPGRYCVLYPETRGGQFPRDLPKILKAEGKAGYAMTQAEVDTVLNEVVPYWKGKTPMSSLSEHAPQGDPQGDLTATRSMPPRASSSTRPTRPHTELDRLL